MSSSHAKYKSFEVHETYYSFRASVEVASDHWNKTKDKALLISNKEKPKSDRNDINYKLYQRLTTKRYFVARCKSETTIKEQALDKENE